MAESTSASKRGSDLFERTCECGVRFQTVFRGVRGGRGPVRCKPCGVAAQRRSSRDADRRKILAANPGAVFLDDRSTVAARKCVDCNSLAERGRHGRLRKRCNLCHVAEKKRRDRALYLKRRAAQPPQPPKPRIHPCMDCGCDVVSQPKGGLRRRCDSCRPAHVKETMNAWRAANPELWQRVVRQAGRKRRAMKRLVASEPYDSIQVFERDGWRCHLCNKKIRKDLKHPHPKSASIDHVVPLADGGPDTLANVAAAHLTCNQRKNRYGGGEQLRLIG